MQIRRARPEDLDTFRFLWRRFLEEANAMGIREMLPTHRTLWYYVRSFDAVVSGRSPGVCLAVEVDGEVVAMSLAAGIDVPWDTGFGRCAAGLGSVVHPDHRGKGYADPLLRAMRAALREEGFDSWLGSGHVENKRSLETYLKRGWKVYAVAGRMDLREDQAESGGQGERA